MSTAVNGWTHPDFPLYWVFDDGSVLSVVGKTPRVLKPGYRGNYLGMSIVDRLGKLRGVYLHRLVAEAWHGMPASGQEVRHLDGDKLNNRPDNLAWGTRSQNMRDKEAHGTAPQGERHPQSKLTDSDVRRMRKMWDAGASLPDLEKEFRVSRMTCWRAATGRSWSHLKEI